MRRLKSYPFHTNNNAVTGTYRTGNLRSETNKAEPRSSGDHSSIRDFSPIAFVHADIFNASHKGVPPLERLSERSNLLHKGRPLILSGRAFGPRNLMKIVQS